MVRSNWWDGHRFPASSFTTRGHDREVFDNFFSELVAPLVVEHTPFWCLAPKVCVYPSHFLFPKRVWPHHSSFCMLHQQIIGLCALRVYSLLLAWRLVNRDMRVNRAPPGSVGCLVVFLVHQISLSLSFIVFKCDSAWVCSATLLVECSAVSIFIHKRFNVTPPSP